MDFFDRLNTLSNRLAQLIALIGLAGLLCLSFATVLDVLLTWFFRQPIVGVRDASTLFVAIIIAASLPVCTAERQHITIQIAGFLLGKKIQKIVGILAHFITLAIFILMTWQLWLYTNELSIQNEITMVLGWPVAPWWRMVSMIVSSCVLIQGVVIVTTIRSTFCSER